MSPIDVIGRSHIHLSRRDLAGILSHKTHWLIYIFIILYTKTSRSLSRTTPNYGGSTGLPFTESYGDQAIYNRGRSYGPMWGGTELRISLDYLPRSDFNITSIHFGGYYSFVGKYTGRPEWIAYSPMSYAPGSVLLTVYNEKGQTVSFSTELYFEYRQNPVLSYVTPTTHFTSGGTRLTVFGSNLDASATAAVNLTIDTFSHITGSVFSESSSWDCYGYNTTLKVLVCRMPSLNLTQSIQRKLEKEYNISTKSYRRRRSTNLIGTLDSDDGSETASISLDILLDGQSAGTFITSEFTFIPPDYVSIHSVTEVITITKGKGKRLMISGENLLSGAGPKDYSVPMGVENCTITDITDNMIVCSTPSEEPASSSVRGTCNGGLTTVTVSIALEQFFHYGCAQYSGSYMKLFIIIPAVIGAALVLLLLIIVLAVCTRYCRRKAVPSPPTNQRSAASDSRTAPSKGQGQNHDYSRSIQDQNYQSNYNRNME